jgi:hypothetical protein
MNKNLQAVLSTSKSTVKFFLRPKRFAAERTIDTRLKFHKLFRLIAKSEVGLRTRMLADLKPKRTLTPIDDQKGFLKLEDLDPEIKNAALQSAQNIFRDLNWKELREKSVKKYLVTEPFSSADRNHPLMKFALDPSMLKLVGDYVGMLPVLENILLWYSPNDQTEEASSQNYHLDGQDVRTVQILMALEDIDEDSGPFVFVEAQASERVARETGYQKAGYARRMQDETLESRIDRREIHKCLGVAGTTYLCDSDRCFHYGSREAKKPRAILAFQYYTPIAFSIPWRFWEALPLAKVAANGNFTELEKTVLGLPARRQK